MSDHAERDRMIERIQREAGVPNLLEVLSERLDPTDLQSLLLEVYRRRAMEVTPARLLQRYEQDRFVRPAGIDPKARAALESLAWSLLPESYQAIELSPLAPIGANAAIATVDQNKVVTTTRNTEVVADSTNVLALEAAVRRRSLLRRDPRSRERIRLATSHRLVRAQAYSSPTAAPHFQLLGLCVAGRAEGAFRFETSALVEHIGYYLRLLGAIKSEGFSSTSLHVALTDLDGSREQVLRDEVIAPLQREHPTVVIDFDPDRETGRGYYVAVCFHLYARKDGQEMELGDGGFTTWTQQLLSNRKERLLISGMGLERLL